MIKFDKKITLVICIGSALINGCSMFNKQSNPAPLPPQSINTSNAAAPAVAPTTNAANNKTAKIESNNYTESQSQYKRRQVVEDRGPGGAVNKITVDNAGNVPDYVLYPTDQTQYNTNDNPDRLSVPNWQFSW